MEKKTLEELIEKFIQELTSLPACLTDDVRSVVCLLHLS
jgi:hypothetical protein